MNSDLDLFTIRDKGTLEGASKLMKKLYTQSLPPSLKNVVDTDVGGILSLRKDGKISGKESAKYGAVLILHFILGMDKVTKDIHDSKNHTKDIREHEMARQLARRKGGDNPLAAMKRDSGTVSSLVNAVDPSLPHPKDIRRQPRPKTTRTPWMDVDTFFKILRSGFEEMKKEDDELARMFGLSSLLSAPESLEKKKQDIMTGMGDFSLD